MHCSDKWKVFSFYLLIGNFWIKLVLFGGSQISVPDVSLNYFSRCYLQIQRGSGRVRLSPSPSQRHQTVGEGLRGPHPGYSSGIFCHWEVRVWHVSRLFVHYFRISHSFTRKLTFLVRWYCICNSRGEFFGEVTLSDTVDANH